MSIASEITRLQAAKADIMAALVEKGVDVTGKNLVDVPDLIDSIEEPKKFSLPDGCIYLDYMADGYRLMDKDISILKEKYSGSGIVPYGTGTGQCGYFDISNTPFEGIPYKEFDSPEDLDYWGGGLTMNVPPQEEWTVEYLMCAGNADSTYKALVDIRGKHRTGDSYLCVCSPYVRLSYEISFGKVNKSGTWQWGQSANAFGSSYPHPLSDGIGPQSWNHYSINAKKDESYYKIYVYVNGKLVTTTPYQTIQYPLAQLAFRLYMNNTNKGKQKACGYKLGMLSIWNRCLHTENSFTIDTVPVGF